LASNVTQHPQLKYPLVAEALFEIRFESSLPYGIVPGRLYEALKGQFPTANELPLAKVPVQVGPPHIVRHRFYSHDESRLFQTGVGVLTVNHLRYKGFRQFLSDCESVLAAANSIRLWERVIRTGLHYINKAPLNQSKAWNQIVSPKVELPNLLESKVQGRSLTWLTGWGEEGSLQVTIGWPTVGEAAPALILDLEAFRDSQAAVAQTEIIEWLNNVHENLYQTFKACLTPSYFDALKGESNVASA
jgi:uncharacterized protein (TIGR04255 family)